MCIRDSMISGDTLGGRAARRAARARGEFRIVHNRNVANLDWKLKSTLAVADLIMMPARFLV
eukprot:4413042-Pyramimonas_sp.AAC.1